MKPTGTGSVCRVLNGTYKSRGHNVAPDPFGCDLDRPGDRLADPLLAPVPADNGGPTETVKLLAGSPAIDRVPVSKCKAAQGVDQRGYRRPAGIRCDSGSYERGAKAK